MLILATTLPLPAGYFMPIFIYGESGHLLAWTKEGAASPGAGVDVGAASSRGPSSPWGGG